MNVLCGSVPLALVVGLVLACSKPPELGPIESWHGGPVLDVDQVVSTDGTIRVVVIDAGCWALQTPVGDYEPANLPQKYRVNGLRVHVVIRGTSDGSYCGLAPVVALDSIVAR